MTVGPPMASDEPSLLSLPSNVASTPVRALNESCRKQLALHLNPEKDTLENGKATDWRGLGECCGFDCMELDNFALHENPTLRVLKEWGKNPEASIGRLVEFFKEMGRWDIIEDDIIHRRIEHDVKSFMEAEERRRVIEESENGMPKYAESDAIVKGDVDGDLEYFDAFVCYTHSDFEWLRTMMFEMEKKRGLKLCIIGRDLIGGTCKYSAISKLIKERCRKMVIIISQNYSNSEECDFQTHFAHALAPGSRSKRLIPVVIEKNVRIPDVLVPITLLDYTKDDLIEWFWGKLDASIRDTKTTAAQSKEDSTVTEGNFNIHKLSNEELTFPVQREGTGPSGPESDTVTFASSSDSDSVMFPSSRKGKGNSGIFKIFKKKK
ncbi:hypothetical protein CAPTEDRAFT_182573 [Capitella teleta]|uniref:TIR domain-containing protein n=1 Tax=Capitella teleta TaxID=283909 RepID=R7TI89_CAPTE|nr:hypothetical protein CAPTEDRAFT_182573 [Capitella teleta]|eukprot:ELT91256.1 hypothetical protein CAPTEDRAFT_182573 [Capitella teleta]